ncbi:MAG: tetratricopeptide repeat protein [Bacteroidales bacterium]|nr:tetratricopeptide repeat protein [Bacteroidales bacterium]
MDVRIKQKEALQLIIEGKYTEFFNLIDQLNFKDWLKILLPKNPNNRNVNGKYHFKNDFWSAIIKSKHFPELIKNNKYIEKVDLLFDYYFKKEANANNNFNKPVSEINPKLFIEKFKTSKYKPVFNDKFINNIRQFTTSKNSELKLFSEFIIYVNEIETNLWQEFESDAKIWLNLNPVELFAYASYYIVESDRLNKSNHLYTSLNVLFSYYFFESKDNKTYTINEKIFIENSMRILMQCIENSKNKYFESLKKLQKWNVFVEDIASVYLFYDNYYLSETKYSFHLNCIDTIEESKWRTIGKKIEFLPMFIEASNYEIAELYVKDNISKIPGKTQQDKDINKREAIRDISQSIILNSMQYTHYEVAEKKIEVSAISHLLNGLIHNATEKYYNPLHEYQQTTGNSGIESLLFAPLTGHLGVRFESVKEFSNMLGNTLKMQNDSKEIRNVLCFNPVKDTPKKYFNRHTPFVNIVAQPLFELNSYIISLESFLGKLTNSYNIIRENTYFHKTQFKKLRPIRLTQQEDKDFEKYFLELFSGYKFDKIGVSKDVCKKNENGKEIIIGDIDVYILHEGILLLVELKRTRFRKQLHELQIERKEINEHASHQLIKIQKFLKDEQNHEWINKKLGIDMQKVKKILPLIITTSMEQDGEMINDILKKSFFEFNFYALFFDRQLDNILQKFYNVLKEDEIWKNIAKEFKKIDKDFIIYQQPEYGLNYRHSYYKKAFTPSNVPDDENEFKQFDIGNEYFEQKDYNNAIIHFEKAHKINPHEASYIDLIATCLAELGQKETAMQQYDKALKLRKDYFIWQNMLVTAKELDSK